MTFPRPAIPPHAEHDIATKRLAVRASWHSLKAQAWKESVIAYFAGTRGLREDASVTEAIANADKILAAYEHRFGVGFEQIEEDEAEATRTMYEQSPMLPPEAFAPMNGGPLPAVTDEDLDRMRKAP